MNNVQERRFGGTFDTNCGYYVVCSVSGCSAVSRKMRDTGGSFRIPFYGKILRKAKEGVRLDAGLEIFGPPSSRA